jgi:hydrogenase/urease accessory protein HupE
VQICTAARAKERQMTKLVSLSVFIMILSMTDAFAFGPSGDHSGNIFQLMVHMLTEPDHLAMLSAAGALAFVLYKYLQRAV